VNRAAAETEYLRGLADGPVDPRRLARAAVLLARTVCPDADPDRVDGILAVLGEAVRREGRGAETAAARSAVLAEVLARRHGLRGSVEDPGDPRNSCLECALDRRVGLPLTLAFAWIDAGRRAGWRVEGVDAPRHFLARVRGADGSGLVVDPFHRGEAREEVPFPGRPPAVRAMLLRMLRNLRGSLAARGDRGAVLAVLEDMLLLRPGLPEALRDRGLLRVEGGEPRAGLEDLRAFLGSGPEAHRDPRVLATVARLTEDGEQRN